MPPAAEFDISLERPAIAYLIHTNARKAASRTCISNAYFARGPGLTTFVLLPTPLKFMLCCDACRMLNPEAYLCLE